MILSITPVIPPATALIIFTIESPIVVIIVLIPLNAVSMSGTTPSIALPRIHIAPANIISATPNTPRTNAPMRNSGANVPNNAAIPTNPKRATPAFARSSHAIDANNCNARPTIPNAIPSIIIAAAPSIIAPFTFEIKYAIPTKPRSATPAFAIASQSVFINS